MAREGVCPLTLFDAYHGILSPHLSSRYAPDRHKGRPSRSCSASASQSTHAVSLPCKTLPLSRSYVYFSLSGTRRSPSYTTPILDVHRQSRVHPPCPNLRNPPHSTLRRTRTRRKGDRQGRRHLRIQAGPSSFSTWHFSVMAIFAPSPFPSRHTS